MSSNFGAKKKFGIKKFQKFLVLGELHPAKPPVRGGFAPHTPHRLLRPQAPDAFGLNHRSPLVTG